MSGFCGSLVAVTVGGDCPRPTALIIRTALAVDTSTRSRLRREAQGAIDERLSRLLHGAHQPSVERTYSSSRAQVSLCAPQNQSNASVTTSSGAPWPALTPRYVMSYCSSFVCAANLRPVRSIGICSSRVPCARKTLGFPLTPEGRECTRGKTP